MALSYSSMSKSALPMTSFSRRSATSLPEASLMRDSLRRDKLSCPHPSPYNSAAVCSTQCAPLSEPSKLISIIKLYVCGQGTCHNLVWLLAAKRSYSSDSETIIAWQKSNVMVKCRQFLHLGEGRGQVHTCHQSPGALQTSGA